MHDPDAEPRDLDLAVVLEPGRDFVEVVASMMAWLRSDTLDELEIAAVLRMADTQWCVTCGCRRSRKVEAPGLL